MMESSSGIGLLLGPFAGAILYEIGGYTLPFFVLGIILTCLIILFNSWSLFLFVPLDCVFIERNQQA